MTEGEACAALRGFVAVGELERWIAEQPWEVAPGGWAVAGELHGLRFRWSVFPVASAWSRPLARVSGGRGAWRGKSAGPYPAQVRRAGLPRGGAPVNGASAGSSPFAGSAPSGRSSSTTTSASLIRATRSITPMVKRATSISRGLSPPPRGSAQAGNRPPC